MHYLKIMFEKEKYNSAIKSLEEISDDMVVGLGTGTTVNYAIKALGKKNMNIVCIPTSTTTSKLAKKCNLKLASLNDYDEIDVAIDGCDEIDEKLNMIKGRHGALLMEKIVLSSAKNRIIIADYTKFTTQLGKRTKVPIEVLPSAYRFCKQMLLRYASEVHLRNNFITDNNNYILDCKILIKNQKKLTKDINNIPGVIENGLFIGLCDVVIIGYKNSIKILKKGNENSNMC